MNIQKKLQSLEIRPSVQRMAVMDYLMKHRTHPTIDTIYGALQYKIPTLSKTTVYNIVKTLSESGAIQTIFIDEKNLRYDAQTEQHAHFKCNSCGMVADLPIKELQVKVKNPEKLSIEELHLYYKGLCKKCKNKHK
ncbi:MAG: transcriptional repressor [Bacteroidales bacterium]|nr:transcriptional repressor [Bacteroidales bacterium]